MLIRACGFVRSNMVINILNLYKNNHILNKSENASQQLSIFCEKFWTKSIY